MALRSEIRKNNYMAELAIQSVRKMTYADWLPSRPIPFSYRPASFGGKMSELI